MQEDNSKQYVKTLVYVFIMFGSFIVAIVSAYFSLVGLYFGQGIVEVDVFEDKYKYRCNYNFNTTEINDSDDCTIGAFNTSSELPSWTQYQADRTELNGMISKFLLATFVIFSLLGLVFLFLALKSAGLGRKKEAKGDSW